MGLWADTFGGGNSFTESVANTFTPNDGKEYRGGSLVDSKTDKVIAGGRMDNADTGQKDAKVGSKSSVETSTKTKGSAPGTLQKFTIPGMVGQLVGWANSLDPTKDTATVVGNRQVYDNGTMQYSYNFLGMPYEVKVVDGKVVDANTIKGEDGKTGYERLAQEARDRGDNDSADKIMEEAAANAEAQGATGTNMENVTAATDRFNAISEASGMAESYEQVLGIADNPTGFMSERGLNLSDVAPQVDPNAAGTVIDPNDPRFALTNQTSYNPTLATTDTVGAVVPRTAADVTTADATARVAGEAFTVDPATGQIRDENLVDASTITADIEGLATGRNADGSTNFTGQALNQAATLNISRMIDTSTAAGKLLASKLGEGNYTDTKATILGQMSVIAGEFKDSNGNPRIPPWGQAVSRDINRTIAFTGVTGTAAKAAVTNAMMEATLGIAESEAKFFQTATLENLSNRQQSIINKANVLAQMEVENLNAREAAAVNNAKSFLQMDLANLDNEQQAEVVNKQARVDALFTATAEENVNRRFNITNDMDMAKFYDELAFQAERFNADSTNAMSRFNAGETNAASQFGIEQEASRQRFEAEMAYNIDAANAKWRQSVELENTRITFEAASTDVKNALGLSTEALNRIWDRVDNQLDYIWRSTEADEQRDYDLLMAEMNAAGAAAQAKAAARGSIWGAIIGGAATVGAAAVASDIRLKEDIQLFDTMPSGVKLYTWRWNEEGKRIGADRFPGFGVLAQEIQETHPDAVSTGDHGYLMVNYRKVLA
jgi:hypothetical protein